MMSAEQTEELNHPSNKVDLFISCQKLVNLDNFSKTDPYVKVFMKEEKGTWNEIGETEKQQNDLDPEFKESIQVNYYFQKT